MDKIWMVDSKFTELDESKLKELPTGELAAYTADKSKNDVDNMVAKFNKKIENATKNFLDEKGLEKVKKDFTEALKNMNKESLDAYIKTIDDFREKVTTAEKATAEVKEIVRKQGETLKTLNSPQIPAVRRKVSKKEQLKALITAGLSSDEFKAFEGRGFSGASNKMFLDNDEKGNVELKDIATKTTVGVSDHTGNVMISEISDIVRDDTPTRKEHVRDLLNVSMTDQAQIVAGQVYDFTDSLTLGAVVLAENGEAPESVFKSKENTWGIKRIANSMRISKREIRTNGLKWVMDKVLAKLPDATLNVEDFELLFGDGAGNNVKGMANDARAFNLIPNTYSAGDIASVATYNGGTQVLVTFTDAHGIANGDDVAFANASESTYNATHKSVEVVNAKQILIDLAYVAEADTSSWTGTDYNPFYHSIDQAQEYDVLAVSDANLEAGEYACGGHIVNKSQQTQLGLLKDNQYNYLNITKDANGKVVSVNGKPLLGINAMSFGKFISADFSRNGMELKEFTPLNIQFVEDVTTVKKNEIVVVIEEEIIFPIYNPYWVVYGKFSTAKTQIETP